MCRPSPGPGRLPPSCFQQRSRSWFRAEMEHDSVYRAWVESGCTGRCSGGESLAEFSDRVWDAFVPLLEIEAERLVIVAHGGVQMAILERYARPHRGYFHWQSPCGGGFVLDGQTLIDEVHF